MPDYFTLADLNAIIPGQFLTQALDDNNDGAADPEVITAVQASVAREIDAVLGTRFAVPFYNPIPAIVHSSAVTLAADTLYVRRGMAKEQNPHAERAAQVRKQLERIAAGEIALLPEVKPAGSAGAVIGEPIRSGSRTRRLAT
jgi:phage gp36-like protein